MWRSPREKVMYPMLDEVEEAEVEGDAAEAEGGAGGLIFENKKLTYVFHIVLIGEGVRAVEMMKTRIGNMTLMLLMWQTW